MKFARNTISALGLILLGLAAGNAALAASENCSAEASCEATCSGNNTSCQVAGNSACSPGCDADSGSLLNSLGLPDEPLFDACGHCFKDLCDTCDGCKWTADASVLILHRAIPGTRTVLTDPTTGADLFDASRLEYPFAAGPRVSLTALDCEGWGFELNYFGIDGWSASEDVPNASLPSGAANLAVDSATNLSLTNAHFESIARLYSGEANFRKPLFGNISFLAGFRWLEMYDRYVAEGTSFTTRNIASETILTHNHLYGFQIGADGIIAQEADRWRIRGFVKGGIFGNSADQATSLSDPGGLGSREVNVNNQAVAAFFGETGFVGYLQVTKHLSLSGGYEVMFASNVAQPVNQISSTNLATASATVDTSASLFYHGATAGLEVTW